MKSLYITSVAAFEKAKAEGAFAAATVVWLYNLPGITAVPDMPAATDVRLDNLPGITAVPDMPAATVVRLYNLPKLPANTPAPKCAPRGTIYRNGRVWK